ncbi:MAG: transcription antitermination factor NusB [Eubacteriales bacterium]|jgi:N utilization substance protein B|nr:transcription antitermination factor NusB [Oscillospiraceae bacterium]MBQ1247203.1 transcription antitermination factor NusB [Clostridiales bacterium]MDO4420670.1 transcription antitermination factor NusB [Eubacteriales bacterium]MBQ1297135.1 transcription antitermination factor NusB [Clostridiales bacterium]MBQ1571589.1 transcription antitermination factor NusB [Clostridiales bacterium]
MSRIETREHAMELLFQIGFRNDPISNQIETFKENFPEVIEDEAYFLDIVYGVINSRDELDEKFVPFLKNWKLERLPQTDRIILEIAVYEILTVEEIPTSVSINEAVKLAKKYGTDNSSSYINGVLSNFVKSI